MSIKTFTQVSVILLVIMAFFAVPSPAQAGGVCGGSFVVERGDTIELLAAMCGTTVSAITAANPGLSSPLTIGQTITIPGANYSGPNVPAQVTATPTTGTTTVTNNYYITNNYYNNGQSGTTTTGNGTTYTVQAGDTFAQIAKRFGVTIEALRAANPGIPDINLLYVGQILNLPGTSSGGITIVPVPTQELIPRSWGSAPKGTPSASVRLTNKSKAEAYISLQGQMRDDSEVINEYPVKGMITVHVPSGWYIYVAWVGGRKMVGQFNLPGDTTVSLTIYKDKIVVGQEE